MASSFKFARRQHVDGTDIVVTLPGKLSDKRREYLKTHKALIIKALLAANDPPIMVEYLAPSGRKMVVPAESQQCADFIREMNPKPGAFACADCLHATITRGVGRCRIGTCPACLPADFRLRMGSHQPQDHLIASSNLMSRR